MLFVSPDSEDWWKSSDSILTVLEHVRGCAQANEASKAKQMENFSPLQLFSPLLAKGRLGKQLAYR